jgi:hypothetical protein
MAAHVHSIKDSEILKVTTTQLYQKLRGGDLLFCSGQAAISKGIEVITGSPFSHVLMAWLPFATAPWCTLESTIDKGVHVGLLDDYINSYKGDLVLTYRPALTQDEILASIKQGLSVLDYTYDWQSEVSQAARKLLKHIPAINPKHEYYCSALQYYMSLVTRSPFKKPMDYYPTPEDNWLEPTVVAKCAIIRS